MNYYIEVLKKYAVFSGRARRAEYWYFSLFSVIVSLILAFVDGVTGMYNPETGIGTLGLIYSLAVLIPGIAVTVRRLHDTGRSAWWLLIALLPILGVLIILVFMVLPGKEEENSYGPNPIGATS